MLLKGFEGNIDIWHEKLISFVFPKVCGICKKKINEKYTCEKCSNILKYSMKRELCVRNINSYVDKLISLFVYQDKIRESILQFKFDGKAYIGKSFSELMCEIIISNKMNIDMVIPVPIHRKRYLERGYNQSEILSKFISHKINVRHDNKVLKKVKNNLAQSTLETDKRKKNVLNVYQFNINRNIIGKRILLVDDIYTTGATANECAKVLKENGAKEVICMTIAYSSKILDHSSLC